MGRSFAASLLIGTLVGAMLLALYRLSITPVFFLGASKLESIYQGIFLLKDSGQPGFYLPLQYFYYTVMAFVSAWVCLELPRPFGRVAYLAGAVFLTLILSPALRFCGILFEPFSGAAAIVLSGLCGMIIGGTETGQRRHRLQRYFVGRLSAGKFAKLIGAKGPLDISGKRELTVLNCRILNYPDLSSQMEPHDLEQLSSMFLQATAEFLVSRGAYLDSCNAEGVRVFFGMPDDDEEHAGHGCRAALELRQRLVNLEQEMQNRWHRKPAFGVALATGPMSIGLFGFREFQFFSAVGEPTDFSRRLCSINLVYGSHVLVNSRTFHLANERMEMRPMEMVYAPRMHQVSEVYELLAEKGTLNDEETKARDAFWQGVVSLRKGAYQEAVRHLQTAKLDGREDPPLKYFLERAEAGLKDDQSTDEHRAPSRHVRVLTAN
jgi:class 3 adenylate cyclase